MNAPVRFTGMAAIFKPWSYAQALSQSPLAKRRRALANYEWRAYEAARPPVTLPALAFVARADARMKALDAYLRGRKA